MQQPPQYGQGQQGYPGYPQQPGYPPRQGYPQQPGYPPPGYPPPGYGGPVGPPKKKRTGLILGIVGTVVVLLGAGIPLAIFASDYFASTGAQPSSAPAPAECRIPAQVLAKAGFPSFAGTSPVGTSSSLPGLKQIGCGFKPGPDENVRDATLSVRIVEYSGENARQQAQGNFMPTKPEVAPTEVRGLGDKAALVHLVTNSAFSGAELHVLKGTNVVTVEVNGWDKGFFSNSPIPQQESDDAVKAVAAEVVKNLPR